MCILGEGGDCHMTIKLNTNRKFKLLLVCIIILSMSVYFHRLFSADLLTNWRGSRGVIGDGSSRFYVINSSNGARTYVPSFLLPLIGYVKPNYDEITAWQKTIRGLSPEFDGQATIVGWLDKDNIAFKVLAGRQRTCDVYVYNITNNNYELLTTLEHAFGVLAGKGKIFYWSPIEGHSNVIISTYREDDAYSDDGTPIVHTSEAYEPIYIYYPSSKELIKIGQYLVFPRELDLIMVLR